MKYIFFFFKRKKGRFVLLDDGDLWGLFGLYIYNNIGMKVIQYIM